MTILYNCHTDGDNYRITKFNDGEVESSYLCSTTECQCPAGSRPICRHRLMLPMFLDRGAVDTFWFLDFERKGWVSNEPAELLETRLATKPITELDIYIDTVINSKRSELGSSNLEPAPLLPIADYALSRKELEELATYHGEIELLPEPAYGIGPMITNAIPLIEADNERTRLRNVENEAQSKPSWRRI